MTKLTEEIKSQIDKKLQAIANILLINSSFTPNLGLMSGKTGVTIFFYQYARYLNKDFYWKFGDSLIDEIFEQITQTSALDFANGLTGIGWGMEYLASHGFVDADMDEVLEDCDNMVQKNAMGSAILIQDQLDLYGYGFYYSSRIENKSLLKNSLAAQRKKHMLVYLHDDCERLLTKDELFEFQLPKLKIRQLNSIIFSFIKMQQLHVYPLKLEELLKLLPKYVKEKADNHCDEIDIFTFSKLIGELCKNITDASLQNEYREAIAELSNQQHSSVSNPESSFEEFIKIGWYAMLYSIDYSQYKNSSLLLINTFSLLETETFWYQIIKNKNNELTALALSLLYLVDKKMTMTPTPKLY